jgi:oxygen-independent coproporphyrinogen-3 oxidase
VRKCPYCDFNSHALRGPVDQGAYVDALLLDLDHETQRRPLGEIGSIFFGGGTPSLLEGRQLARLLDGIDRRLHLAGDIEITLEANPGTAEASRFVDFRAAGVNRLSLGIQSLDDASLAALGRIHDAREAREAVRLARAAGFDNINLDLMFGLPQQTPGAAASDLRQLIALEPEHVSWYQLTLEPNTRFHYQPPPLPDDDTAAAIADEGMALLADYGYARYEISAYAAEGRRCRHNLNYWCFGDYLGVGAGAHGKLTAPDGAVQRRSKRRHPDDYLRHASAGALSSQRTVDAAELPVEFMLNALRLVDGVPQHLFTERTGLDRVSIASSLAAAHDRGLMHADRDRLQATDLGLRFLNDLLALFEPDSGMGEG